MRPCLRRLPAAVQQLPCQHSQRRHAVDHKGVDGSDRRLALTPAVAAGVVQDTRHPLREAACGLGDRQPDGKKHRLDGRIIYPINRLRSDRGGRHAPPVSKSTVCRACRTSSPSEPARRIGEPPLRTSAPPPPSGGAVAPGWWRIERACGPQAPFRASCSVTNSMSPDRNRAYAWSAAPGGPKA